jgi:hypothetical protein
LSDKYLVDVADLKEFLMLGEEFIAARNEKKSEKEAKEKLYKFSKKNKEAAAEGGPVAAQPAPQPAKSGCNIL